MFYHYPKTFTYNGKKRKPELEIDRSSTSVWWEYYSPDPGVSDYTVSYTTNGKSIGKHTVEYVFDGNYTGTVALNFTIVPKGTYISKISSLRKGFTVKWKKQSTQTSGYQIRYCLKSSMKNAKVVTVKSNKTLSKTIKNLKSGKNYYVQVRTYKTVNGTKYCSSWSKKKTIKTR